MTIHQPGLHIFRLLDNLVMLAKDIRAQDPARLAYYGPAYPDAAAFFGSRNAASSSSTTPEELFQAVSQRPAADWEDAYLASSYFREYVVERARSAPEGSADVLALETPAPSLVFQWMTLVRRGLTIKLKDRFNSAILLIQAPVVAVLIVLVFGKQVSQDIDNVMTWQQVFRPLGITLFLMALAAVWFGASNAVREIVGEWAIYQRERMVNLSILAYVASKFTILGGLAVIQCVTLLGITFGGCRLQSSPFLLLGLLLLAAFIGITLGLILSAVARTSEVAIALLPIVLLAMVIVGGVMQPIHEMHKIAGHLSAINPARWCFEGMILLESGQRKSLDERRRTVVEPKSPEAKDMAEHYFPRAKLAKGGATSNHRGDMTSCFAALLVLLAVCAAGSPVILRLRDLKSMSMVHRHD